MNIEDIIVKKEDVILLIDGTKLRNLMPKIILNDYEFTGKTIDFKSTYSIYGIIVQANNIEKAIEQYKNIKVTLLE